VKSAFDRALAQTLGFEGGWSDTPGDRGGRTNYGITQRAYDTWRTTTGQNKRLVDLIDDAEVRAIYLADYWMPCRCSDLPDLLAMAVFDFAVHSGAYNAKLALQRALGVRADGVIGPVTIATAMATDPKVATLRLLKKRAAFLQECIHAHPEDVKFLEGWIVRLLDQAFSAGGEPCPNG
jgi:lysozyme family protein